MHVTPAHGSGQLHGPHTGHARNEHFVPPSSLPVTLPSAEDLLDALPAELLACMDNTRARYTRTLQFSRGSWRAELVALEALATSTQPNLLRGKAGWTGPLQKSYFSRIQGNIHRWLAFQHQLDDASTPLSLHSYIRNINTFFLFLAFLMVRKT